MTSNALGYGALFREGHLAAAVDSATAAVRREPADASHRLALAEFLLFTGALERVDTVLAAAQAADPSLAIVVAEFRQLLRAAVQRRALAAEGRPPEFLGQSTESQVALLRAAMLLREGDRAAAAAAARDAEAVRAPAPGTRDGTMFDDFRDTDDLVGGNVEVLTTTGRFFWIDVARVRSMVVHKPNRPRDLFWPRCTMSVQDGPDGEVYLPALYDATGPSGDEALVLGRATAWNDGEPVRGSGQRVLLVGEEGVPIHELGTIEFRS